MSLSASCKDVGRQTTHQLRRGVQRLNAGSQCHAATTCSSRPFALGLMLLTVLSACTDTAPRRAVTLHPVADNLLSANRDILSVPRVDQGFIDAQPFAAANERAQRVFGREKGSELEAYGDVASAEILSTGHVVLLDRSDGLIRVIDESDVGVAAGGLGQGPGEIVEPITLFSHRDSLFVLDRARAVHVFAMPEGSKPAYARTVRLPFEAEDA